MKEAAMKNKKRDYHIISNASEIESACVLPTLNTGRACRYSVVVRQDEESLQIRKAPSNIKANSWFLGSFGLPLQEPG